MSPLPTDEAMKWPPEGWGGYFQEVQEHAAWWSGDPEQLRSFYQQNVQAGTDGAGWLRRFWKRAVQTKDDGPASDKRGYLHVPIAGDISSTSADLLFSESPKVVIPEALGGALENDPNGSAPEDQDLVSSRNEAIQAQDRLIEIIEEGGIESVLLEAAEVASALSGVYLRPAWDQEVSPDTPLLDIVHPDRAVPEFSHGILKSVTFWTSLQGEGSQVFRHLERHEDGVILHGLYEGTADKLGRKIPLTEHPITDALSDSLSDGDQIDLLGFKGTMVVYIPNIKPNRKHRGLQMGRSDYAGVEGLMDALDETYTSWMRDIRLGVARLVVPDEFLEFGSFSSVQTGEWKTPSFNMDREVFSPVHMSPNERDGNGIEKVQFEIRMEQHRDTAIQLVEEILSKAGYSPQTFRPTDSSPESGAALKRRERKSWITKSKKERYWKPGLEKVFETLLYIDAKMLGHSTPVLRPRVIPQDSIAPDIDDLASTATLLRSAEAASTEVRVRLVHPDWGNEEVLAEVEKITSESSMTVPSPTGMPDPEDLV